MEQPTVLNVEGVALLGCCFGKPLDWKIIACQHIEYSVSIAIARTQRNPLQRAKDMHAIPLKNYQDQIIFKPQLTRVLLKNNPSGSVFKHLILFPKAQGVGL